jgi:tetratricopeptide (TPR) repeat protein
VTVAGEILPQEPRTTDGARLADALIGADLPLEASRHLHDAALSYANGTVAEQHLREAKALAGDHAAVLIAQYRFYFYKGRLRDALDVARICLLKAARENGLHADWRQVRTEDADFGTYDARLPRFFLFTLKAYAYLQMRLGHLEEGHQAVSKLLELDPSDKVGARVLLDVLSAAAAGDEE